MSDDIIESDVYRMDPEEQLLAESFYHAIQCASAHSPRAKQTHFGISSLGWCAEQMRRTLDGQVQDDTDHLSAFIGTAIGDHAEQAFKAQHPEAIIQPEVTTTLTGDSGITYTLVGHPDILLPGLVLDVKTDFGLGVIERTGPSQQQRWQRALYAKAAHEMGLLGDVPLTQVQVGNVWIDRGAVDKRCFVQLEYFDPADIDAATFWLDDVIYSWVHKESARKEPPRNVCFATCGFAADCRGMEPSSAEGLLTDERTLTAVDMYREGTRLEREAKRLKSQAKIALDGVSGSTGEFAVRWTWVNGGHVEFDRKGSSRLEIREIK